MSTLLCNKKRKRRNIANNNTLINNNTTKDVNIKDFNCINTITEPNQLMTNLLLLKDKRIASCSWNNTIRIFSPSNDYHLVQVFQRHNQIITSFCQLDDGTIVSCSSDYSIMIGDYIIKKAHNDYINKVIALPNNRIMGQ